MAELFEPDPFYRPLGKWTHWLDRDGRALTCVYHGPDGYGFVEGHISEAKDFPAHTVHTRDLPGGVVSAFAIDHT